MTTADFFNIGRDVKGPPGPDGAPGRTYALRKPTQIEQGRFSQWLEQRAHNAVERSDATEVQKDRRHAIIDAEAAIGRYEYDGRYGLEARFEPAGMAKIIAIVCRDQGVTDETAEEILAHSLREVAAELIGRTEKDPKVMALVRAALGLTTTGATPPCGESDSSDSTSCSPPSAEPTPNSVACPTTNSSSCTPSSETPTAP